MILVLITVQTGLIVLQKYFFPPLVTVKEARYHYSVNFLSSVTRNWPLGAALFNSELQTDTKRGGAN